MKVIILLISVINFVYFVKCGADLERCASQCQVIYDCLYQNNGDTKNIPIWPLYNNKQPEITKCYCTRKEEYKKCMDCYYQFKKPNEIPSKETINSQCSALLNQQTSTTVPTATTTNPSAVPTNTNGVTQANNNSTQTTTNPSLNNQNIQSDNNVNNKENGADKNEKKSNVVMYVVIGCIAAVAIIGFFVYNNKKKSRPESMPFYGNNVSSPNQFATLDVPKNNATMTYNSNAYNTLSNANAYNTLPNANSYNTLPNNNDYYGQNYGYSQTPAYDNQYGQVQTTDYQYQQPIATIGAEATNVAATATAAVATGTNANNSVSYDTRRESMNQSMSQSMSPSMNQSPVGNTANNNKTIYTCTYPYDPKLDDELELKLYDKVQILEEFEDGWMKAMNLTSGREGMAPMVCVKNN